MKKKRVVIPANMGRGIKANTALSQYEVDLADYVDGTTVTYNNGKLGVNVPAPTPATEIKVKAAKRADGDVVITNQDDTTVEVPAIKVKATKEADGKVVITNQDGSTVEIEKSAPAPATAGLDCEAIDALPEVAWKKGTTLLAKQDGQCVRLAAFDSIFQEVGVGITADKTNSFTNEEYKVVVTVSNTGEGKNELTNLNIVGPANTEDYEIKDVTFTKSEADAVEQVDNLTYNIRGLKKGGTVKVKYTVVPKVLGNYQFTAAVNPNSALDKDLGNNNVTLILNAHTKEDPEFVPSVDCPLVIATELDNNTVLQQLRTYKQRSGNIIAPTSEYRNVFANRTTLKGLRVRLDGASTVVGYTTATPNRNNAIVVGNATTVSANIDGDFSEYLYTDHTSIKNGVGGYTFDAGVLEITEDVNMIAFSCRPFGDNCKWQNYVLMSMVPTRGLSINTSDVIGATVSISKKWRKTRTRDSESTDLVVPNTQFDRTLAVGDVYSKDTPAYVEDKLVVAVRAGTAASLKYTSTNNYAVTQVRGKTTITEDTITVAADAKATDSVNTQYIQVIVEE